MASHFISELPQQPQTSPLKRTSLVAAGRQACNLNVEEKKKGMDNSAGARGGGKEEPRRESGTLNRDGQWEARLFT